MMDKALLEAIVNQCKEDVMPPYDTLIDIKDGFDLVCALCDMFGGTSVYIPKLYTVFARCLDNALWKEFDGSNFRALALKYGFSERHVRNVIGRKKHEHATK